MKIRNGFVSNSSSSSFVCNFYDAAEYNIPFDKKDILEKLQVMYECALKLGFLDRDESFEGGRGKYVMSFEEVFGDITKASKKAIEELNDGWGADVRYHKGMFLINSKRDNSIPHQLFEMIECVFNARRIHLG